MGADPLRGCKVYVWHKPYVVMKSKRSYPDAFASINDRKETTVITTEAGYREEDVISIEKGWRIMTFDIVLPFDTVGFIAKVSEALTKEGVSIFVTSAFSTDHVLVKDRDLKRAEKALAALGCIIEEM